MTNNFLVFGTIVQTIETTIGPLITQGLDFLTGQSVLIQGAILIALGLFAIIGLFVFIKKFIKLFVVLAILGGIGYFVYSQGYLDTVLDSLTSATTAALSFFGRVLSF
jgi:hypothetical protein